MDATTTTAVAMIVTALATGAAAGLKPAAEQAIKDGYAGLKKLVKDRFALTTIESLEQKPDSPHKQGSVAEDLAATGADRDEEVLLAAQKLIKLIESQAPDAAKAAGISISQLRAGGSINIKNLVAPGDINIDQATSGILPSNGQPTGSAHPNS